MNITLQKIITTLLILFTIITLCCGIRYIYLNATIIPYYQNITSQKLEKYVQQINNFLDTNEQQIDTLSHDEIILNHMEQLINNQNQETVLKTLSSHIAIQKEHIPFKNLFLISVDGTILFSTTPKAQGIKLTSAEHHRAPLSKSFQRSLMTLSTDFSNYSRSPILGERAFYITKPLIKNQKIIGTITYQIEDKPLQLLMQDYTHLGKTGETVLGISEEKHILFILPTRHDPYRALKEKKIIETTKTVLALAASEIPLQQASLGGYATSIGYDYRDVKTIASWDFIPRVKWGIVVKIDFDEALQPLNTTYIFLLITSIITLLLLLLAGLTQGTAINALAQIIQHNDTFTAIPKNLKRPIMIPLIIAIYFPCTSIYQFYRASSVAAEESKKSAMKTINEAIHTIETELQKVDSLANFIAQDLQTKRLISEDIKERIKREILENDNIERITIAFAPYASNKNIQLYAPSIIKKSDATVTEEMIDYDYTDEKRYGEKTDWYTKTMTSAKPQWLNPHMTPGKKSMSALYTLPFYYQESTQPSGVIAIEYTLETIILTTQDTGIGKTGYSFIITKDGTFLYHPLQQLVTDKRTLLQFAQEKGNEELASIATEMKERTPLLKQFIDKTNQKTMWLYSHPIDTNNWTIGTIFAQNEIGLSVNLIRHNLFTIITYVTLMLLIILALFYAITTIEGIINFFKASNGILLMTIFCLWYAIITTRQTDMGSSTRITSQSVLATFITKQTDDAKRLNEDLPIIVPCGILLYSLEQINPKHVSFSGYLWHKYNTTTHHNIQKNIYIPQATNFRVSNEIKTIDGEWETVGMNVIGTIYHEHDYTLYPFDTHKIRIPLEHADFTKKILLVPDLAGYTTIKSEETPGIDKTLSASAFFITETFFDLIPLKQNVNIGGKQSLEKINKYQLGYNAVMSGNLLNPFVHFFLPLLVILISIFSILILEKRTTDPYTIIGPYTGLLFGLVLLHRSLHETAPSNSTLYMEYSFFFTYIIIILLVIHTILAQYYLHWEFYQKQLFSLFKALFWPVQLMAWIITTLVMFY